MPPPKCVSCSAIGSKRAKLISCLHTLCVPCLEKHLQEDGSVKCPECAARTPLPIGLAPLLSLPCSYPQATSDVSAESDTTRRHCDDCLEDESAVAVCKECEICLCDLHTKGHRRSRATHGHTVTLLSSGSPAATAAASGSQAQAAVSLCAVHPSQSLTHFCTPCNQLLCESCQLSGRHSSSGDLHRVIGIEDAFQRTRADVLANAASCSGDGNSGLAGSIEKVRAAMQVVNDETQSASEEATEFFASLASTLQTREHQLLEQLDTLRAQTLLPLERQLARLRGSVARGEQVRGILQSCRNGAEFLRMHAWLSAAVDAARRTAEADAVPCAGGGGVLFAATDTAALLAGVGQAGAVADLKSCGALCRLACSGDPSVDADLEISIQQAETESGCRVALTPDQINAIPFLVEVTSPDGQGTVCPVERSRQRVPGQLRLQHRLHLAGWYVVSATVQGTYIRGSPARVFVAGKPSVSRALRFDAERCDPSMEIADDVTVRKTSHNTWKSVCTATGPPPAAGQPDRSQLRLRVDRTRFGNVCLAACSSSSPRLDHFHTDTTEVFGWFGDGPGMAGYNGGNLGQSWKSGDVVSLTLDGAECTLTGVHERSGRTQVLSDVPPDCFWMVSLFFQDDQVTILS